MSDLPPVNAIGVPTETLRFFTLADLARYTPEKLAIGWSPDVAGFYVGQDDVHDILKHLLSRARVSITLNMFGYDDEELNDILMAQAENPAVLMAVTLDKSQAGGTHEAKLLASDRARNLAAFNTNFVIGQSATHSISHSKGAVIDGIVAFEGSTNWSADGEGTFVVGAAAPGGVGYRAQNNTLNVVTHPLYVQRFETRLRAEHNVALAQADHAAPNRQQKLAIA